MFIMKAGRLETVVAEAMATIGNIRGLSLSGTTYHTFRGGGGGGGTTRDGVIPSIGGELID